MSRLCVCVCIYFTYGFDVNTLGHFTLNIIYKYDEPRKIPEIYTCIYIVIGFMIRNELFIYLTYDNKVFILEICGFIEPLELFQVYY